LDTVVTAVAVHAVAATDEVILADATGGAFDVDLPAPVSGRRLDIKKIDASVNAVTVDGNGALIDGGATWPLAAQWDSVTVVSDGTDWFVV